MAGKSSFLNFEILNSNKKKELINYLENCYDCDVSKLKDMFFYINNNSGKVYVSTIDVSKLKISRINMIGLYFGTFHDEKRFRLSVEGSKFVIPKKNFVLINNESLKSYLAAENLFKDEVLELNCNGKSPFLIVRNNDENLGCVSLKEKFLLNYVPKSRKLDYNKVF